MAGTTTESSVLVNLKDLFEIEVDRRATEAAAKERAKHEALAKIEADRIAREQELEAVRNAERARAEAERIAKDAELEARLRTMRDELADVRAQREEMRMKVAEIATREPSKPSRGSWIAGAMAAASLVAAITATAFAWPHETPVHAQTPIAQPEIVAISEPVVEQPVVEQPVVEEVPVVVAQEDHHPPRCRTERCRQLREDRNHHETLSDQLDFGDSHDVLDHLPED